MNIMLETKSGEKKRLRRIVLLGSTQAQALVNHDHDLHSRGQANHHYHQKLRVPVPNQGEETFTRSTEMKKYNNGTCILINFQLETYQLQYTKVQMLPYKQKKKYYMYKSKRKTLEHRWIHPSHKVDTLRGITSPDEAMKVIKQATDPL